MAMKAILLVVLLALVVLLGCRGKFRGSDRLDAVLVVEPRKRQPEAGKAIAPPPHPPFVVLRFDLDRDEVVVANCEPQLLIGQRLVDLDVFPGLGSNDTSRLGP